MNLKKLKDEVRNNRPRLALVEVVPVIEELQAEIESLNARVAELEKPAKPAPAKKASAKKAAAKSD